MEKGDREGGEMVIWMLVRHSLGGLARRMWGWICLWVAPRFLVREGGMRGWGVISINICKWWWNRCGWCEGGCGR